MPFKGGEGGIRTQKALDRLSSYRGFVAPRPIVATVANAHYPKLPKSAHPKVAAFSRLQTFARQLYIPHRAAATHRDGDYMVKLQPFARTTCDTLTFVTSPHLSTRPNGNRPIWAVLFFCNVSNSNGHTGLLSFDVNQFLQQSNQSELADNVTQRAEYLFRSGLQTSSSQVLHRQISARERAVQ